MGYTDPSDRPGLGATLGGFAVAILFALPMLFVLLIVWTWGAHCSPEPDCRGGFAWWPLGQAAMVLAVAALIGMSVRALLHWAGRRSMEGSEAGGPPAWALFGLTVSFVAALWITASW